MRVILSLRHGPGVPSRPVHAWDRDLTILRAGAQALRRHHRHDAPSRQAANIAARVGCTWLVFAHAGPRPDGRAEIAVSATFAIG